MISAAIQTDIADKRAAILKSTLKLLSERGFHNTPMSVIVKESGVSTGIVYHYFANKDELILELYREIKVRVMRSLLTSYDDDASYKERFQALWKGAIRYYIEHPIEVKFLEQFEHSPYNEMDKSFDFSQEIQSLMMVFQKGIEEGVLKDLPLQVLMELGMTTAVALAKQHIRGALQLSDDVIDSAADACWDMISR